MKGICKKVSLLLVVLSALVLLSGCNGEKNYTAVSDFFFSVDQGHNYGNGAKEYEVGDTIYMKVQYKVLSDDSDKKPSQVKVVLSIPKVKHVDAKYFDGQIITPKYDSVKNVTTYEFIANASKNAAGSECIFQFIPNDVGTIKMTLVYDDNVDASYDKQCTLAFVKTVE